MWVIDLGVIQMEGSWQTLFGKNDSRKIRLLQKIDKAAHHHRVVSDDIKQNTATIPNQHDLSRFRLTIKFSLRNETGIAQDFSQIDRALDRRESVIGNDKQICCFTCSLPVQRRKNSGEIFIRRFDCSER